MNLGFALGGAFQGQRDYDLYLRQRALDQQRLQQNDLALQKGQMDLQQARQNLSMQPQVDQAVFDFFSNGPKIQPPPRMQAPAVPTPPNQGAGPAGPTGPDQVVVPAGDVPGQPAITMKTGLAQDNTPQMALARLQGDISALNRELSAPNLLPTQKQILHQELEKKRAQLASFNGEAPPYKTLAPQPQPQGFPAVPPPPTAPQQGGMTMFDVAAYLKQKGITDPRVAMAVMEKLEPWMNNEAKQELATYKAMLNGALATGRLGVSQGNLEERQRHDQQVEAAANKRIDDMKRRTDLAVRRAENPQSQLTPDELSFMADQALQGDKSVFQNLGRGVQGAQNIVALRNEIARKAKERGISGSQLAQLNAEFAGTLSAERALGHRAAVAGMAVNEADQLADLAVEASNEWNRLGIKSLNELEKKAQSATASPKLRQFVAANNAFINAYARAISPTGTPTVSDKEHAREVLDVAFSQGDYISAIDMMKREMQAALQSPKRTQSDIRDLTGTGVPGGAGGTGALPNGWSVKVK